MKTAPLDIQTETFQSFVTTVKKNLGNHIKKIILFGSRARKDHHNDSDYDCLILVDKKNKNLDKIVNKIAADTLYDSNSVISAFVVEEQRFEYQTYNPLFMNVRKEGVQLI
ncbi:MAG: nucleotidyltransferase domain-containing protein [bacterium]